MQIRPDDWAIVTGASSGIGAALARQLAARRCRLLLAARDTDRLRASAEQLRALGAPCVEWLGVDLAAGRGPDLLLEFAREREIEPGLLVNNAGIGSAGPFAGLDAERERRIVRLNVEAPLALARGFLPRMIESRGGAILFVASTVAFQPMPYMATYGASKACVRSLAEALWEECRGHGVLVSLLCPGLTRTEFHQRAGFAPFASGLGAASADAVAARALRGIERNERLVVPGWRNRVTLLASSLLPRGLGLRITARITEPERRRP